MRKRKIRFLFCLAAALIASVTGGGTAMAGMSGGMGGGMGGGGMGGSDGSGLSTFLTKHFSGSGNCAGCHSRLTDSQGNDVSIDSDWRATMMANSAKDPLWQAKVQSETLRNPALKTVIEDKCSTCHMPMARTQASFDGSSTAILGSGFLSSSNSLHAAAMDGVSCTLCHQIMDVNLGTKPSFTGNYLIDQATAKPDRKIYGQYANPQINPMKKNSSFTPAYGAQANKSELCATCHTLYTPTVDYSGNVVGEMPEQTPYLEWKASRFGDGAAGDDRSCQSCHMPLAGGKVAIANMPMMLAPRDNFYTHTFVGGNAFMLKLLKSNIPALGVNATAAQFDRNINRTNDMLQSQTASVALGQLGFSGDTLEIPVTIANQSGHKFPSGYPARRAWLHLTVSDAQGRILFESGKANADGSIAGADGDGDGALVEPHYDTIEAADQVQIYEAIMKDVNNAATYTLLRGGGYLKDNRLLPAGFNKTVSGEDVKVVGGALSDDDFLGGSDQISYRINLAGYNGAVTVKAELLFQPLSYTFYRDLMLDQAAGDLVNKFDGFYSAADKTPSLVAQATGAITK